MRKRAIVVALTLLTVPFAVRSAVPRSIPFQAQLRTSGGQPLNGSVSVTTSLYNTSLNGTALWTDTQTVTAANGNVSLMLGDTVNPFPGSLQFNQPLWLGIAVGTDAEMVPRLPLATVPYAQLALTVLDDSVSAVQLANDQTSLSKVTGGAMNAFAGNVGIGTALPARTLEVADAQSIVRLTTNTSVNGSVLELRNAAATPSFLGAISFLTAGAAAVGQIGYHADNSMTFIASGSERMRIDPNGRVGIGTTAPSRDVEIQAPSDVELGLKSKDTGGRLWSIQSSGVTGTTQRDGSFQIVDRTAIASRLLIDSSGNVGIGTVAPQARLHVAGDAQVDGAITVPTTTRYASYYAEDFNIIADAKYLTSGAPTQIRDNGSILGEAAFVAVGVHLPDGAVINQIEALVDDSDSGTNKSIQVRLCVVPTGTVGTPSFPFVAVSSGSPGATLISDTGSVTVDNGANCYTLEALWSPANITFYRARIRYTVTSPLP